MKKTKMHPAALTLTLAISAMDATAADHKENPFTLIYEGAIAENVAGKVPTHGMMRSHCSVNPQETVLL